MWSRGGGNDQPLRELTGCILLSGAGLEFLCPLQFRHQILPGTPLGDANFVSSSIRRLVGLIGRLASWGVNHGSPPVVKATMLVGVCLADAAGLIRRK